MSIIFEEVGTKIIPYAIDENGFFWLKVHIPNSETTECYSCGRLFVDKLDPEDEKDRQVVGEECWYSVSEAALYCDNCVTLPTVEP